MAELVKKLGLPRQDGFLYFVEEDGTVWKHQGGKKSQVSNSKIEREEGYLFEGPFSLDRGRRIFVRGAIIA